MTTRNAPVISRADLARAAFYGQNEALMDHLYEMDGQLTVDTPPDATLSMTLARAIELMDAHTDEELAELAALGIIEQPPFVCNACHTSAYGPSAMQPVICYECINAWLKGYTNRLDPRYNPAPPQDTPPAESAVETYASCIVGRRFDTGDGISRMFYLTEIHRDNAGQIVGTKWDAETQADAAVESKAVGWELDDYFRRRGMICVIFDYDDAEELFI